MERDQLVESLEQRIAELEIQKENLAKELEPWLDAEFARNLCEWRDGEMQEVIAREFREVVKAVLGTGKKGKVVASFTLSPGKKGEVRIDLDCKTTLPKWGVDTAIAFADEDGALHRSDPAQIELFEKQGVKRNA